MVQGEKYTVSFKIKLTRDHDTYYTSEYAVDMVGATESTYQNGTIENIWNVNRTQSRTGTNNPFTDWVTVKKTFVVSTTRKTSDMPGLLPFQLSITGSGELKIKEIMMVRGDIIGEYTPASGVSSTIVKQLSNSWAVKNINNAGDIISQINVNPSGVRIKGKNIDIDGNTHITNGVIDEAMIANGAISNAKIANGTIEDAKIKKLDAAKIVGNKASLIDLDAVTGRINYIFTNGILIGNETYMYMSNGVLKINHYGSNTDDVMLQINGRMQGGTRMFGKPSKYTSYTPVMTNTLQNTPVYSKRSEDINDPYANEYVSVYGVRWMGIVTFSGNINVMTNSGAYLYLDDGSGSPNHLWYIPLWKAKSGQYQSIEDAFYNGSYQGGTSYYQAYGKDKTGWV